MARQLLNGAVVSDDGRFYLIGPGKWSPLVSGVTGQPGFRETMSTTGYTKREQLDALRLGGLAAADLVRKHGSLGAAEATMAASSAAASVAASAVPMAGTWSPDRRSWSDGSAWRQASADGNWWWDGAEWRGIPAMSVVPQSLPQQVAVEAPSTTGQPQATLQENAPPLTLATKKTALEHYSVIYLGGLPAYPKAHHGNSIDFLVMPTEFQLVPTNTSRWFSGLVIPYTKVLGFEIVERTVSSLEGILGGINSRQLNQANNIQIEFRLEGQELILRLEMLTGITVMGQAGKCRELMDKLRVHGVLGKFAGKRLPSTPTEDIPAQIAKLAGLRDQGILTGAEFDAKKTELLSRL